MKAAFIQKEILDSYFSRLRNYGYTDISKNQQVLFAVLLLDTFNMFSDMLDSTFEKDVRRIMRRLECCMCEIPAAAVYDDIQGAQYTRGWWEFVSPDYGAEFILALQRELLKKVNKKDLAKVAFTGDYKDLNGKPEINNGKLTIVQDGTTVAEFTANSKADVVAELSSGSALVAKITHDTAADTYSADHTIRELIEAYEAGKTVVAQLDSSVYTLVGYYPYDNIQFYQADSTERGSLIQMYDDDGQDVVEVTAQTSPSARITFTQGGVTKGSFAVNQRFNATIALDAVSEVQSDWTQTDSEAPDFIKNKPIVEGTLTVDITDIHNPKYSTTGLDDLREAGMYDFRVRLNDSGVVYEYDLPLSVEKIVGALGTQEAYIQRITVLPLFYAFLEIPALYTELFRTYDSEEGWSGWSHISLADVALSGDYDDLRNTPVIGDGILTVQKNGVMLDTFRANATANKTINITVPTQASDINALPDTTKYGKSFTLSIDSSTYVVTATLKDQDGNTLGTPQTIDLPLESVVVGGRYDDTTKKVILTLQNGNTIEFSVADLIAGLQSEITANNKLSADLVDDSTATNKFATAAQLTKLDNLQNITTIGSNLTLTNGTLGATDTTYNNFTGADGTNAGAAGLVPAPAATDNTKFLKGDGTWANAGSSFAVNTFTTISNNTSTGSMTPSDVIAAYLIGQVVIGSYYYDRYKLRLVYVNTSTQEVRFEGTVGNIGSATTWTFTGTGLSTTYSVTYVTTSTPNDGVLTITQDGVSKGTFSANQAGNQTIALVSGITYIDHTGD